MIHHIRTILVACALGATALAAYAQVKIGFIGTLSGPAAAVGKEQYDGFMFAVEPQWSSKTTLLRGVSRMKF